MTPVPDLRITPLTQNPINPAGDYILYWMNAYRRVDWNFALQRAVQLGEELGKPLVIFEALRLGYRWANARIHRFVLDGMRDHALRLADSPAHYFPYVERRPGQGKGLLTALAEHAACVVTDDYPAFFLPRMVSAAADQVGCAFEKVDSVGIIPMYAPQKEYKRAYDLRRWLQKNIKPHLDEAPSAHPLGALPPAPRPASLDAIEARWPRASIDELADPAWTDRLPLDHSVPPVSDRPGGPAAAQQALATFLQNRLQRYAERRSHPMEAAESWLSPYLHFGHISAHQIFWELMERAGWSPDDLPQKSRGKREGWWQVEPNTEAFLDELITWRELGFQTCIHRPDTYDQYESLPEWARKTLEEHWDDPREYVYDLADFERARTHDDLWNAAQMQLVSEGKIHNYLRMLWGKKILHWSRDPRVALAIMIELNNKWALDGRDANSYSGIFWTLGRYDRAWQEREIFGKIRYMTSQSTRRKFRVGGYIDHYLPLRDTFFAG